MLQNLLVAGFQRQVYPGRTNYVIEPDLQLRVTGEVAGEPKIDLIQTCESWRGSGVENVRAVDGLTSRYYFEFGQLFEDCRGRGDLARRHARPGCAESCRVEYDDISWFRGVFAIDDTAIGTRGEDCLRVELKKRRREFRDLDSDGFAIAAIQREQEVSGARR